MSDNTPKETKSPSEPVGSSNLEIPNRSIPTTKEEEPTPPQHHDEAEDSTPPSSDGTIAITPWFSSRPPISKALYTKAASQNDALTRLERLYLLARLDLPGKALSCPDELGVDEINQLLGRPPGQILEKNIRRFFRPIIARPSSRPSDDQQDGKGEDAAGKEDKIGQPGDDAPPPRELKTIEEAVKTYREIVTSDDPKTWEGILSYEACECVACGWWMISQDKVPSPWDDPENKKDEAAARAAGELVSDRRSEEEKAFEQKVTEIWCEGGVSSFADADREEEEDENDDEGREERFNTLLKEIQDGAERLRRELVLLVREGLEALSEEERRELVQLRDRERIEVEKERELERREKQKRKLEREEEEEKAKKRRAGRKRPTVEGDEGGHVGGDEEEDGEEGYVLGSLVFDD